MQLYICNCKPNLKIWLGTPSVKTEQGEKKELPFDSMPIKGTEQTIVITLADIGMKIPTMEEIIF